MKLTTLSNILLITSLFLLSPLAASSHDVILIQNTPITVVIETHQPEIKISSSIVGNVIFNVTYVHPTQEETKSVLTNAELTLSVTTIIVDIEDSGYYLFIFLSDTLGNITIERQGIYLSTWIIILFFATVRSLIFVKSRYF